MDHRLIKQILYGFLFIAFIAAAVWLGVFIVKRSNRAVPKIEITDEKKEIQIASLKEIKSAKGSAFSDYIVELANLSDKFGAENIKYSFGKSQGETYLLPLEKKFVIAVGENCKLSESEFKFGDILWVEFSNTESSGLIAQSKKYDAEDKETGGSSVSAIILNKSKYDFSNVDVSVIIYDFDGNPVAVNYSQINTLLSGEERLAKVFWPNYIDKNIADIFIQASSNIMKEDNIRVSPKSTDERFRMFQ